MFLSKALRAIDHPYLEGKGGRKLNNELGRMQGLSIKSLRHHKALQPLFVIMGVGIVFVTAYVGRYWDDTTTTFCNIFHCVDLHPRQLTSTGPRMTWRSSTDTTRTGRTKNLAAGFYFTFYFLFPDNSSGSIPKE